MRIALGEQERIYVPGTAYQEEEALGDLFSSIETVWGNETPRIPPSTISSSWVGMGTARRDCCVTTVQCNGITYSHVTAWSHRCLGRTSLRTSPLDLKPTGKRSHPVLSQNLHTLACRHVPQARRDQQLTRQQKHTWQCAQTFRDRNNKRNSTVYQPKIESEEYTQLLRTMRHTGVMGHADAPVPQFGLAQVAVRKEGVGHALPGVHVVSWQVHDHAHP